MSYRNWLFALAFVALIFGFSQGAYGWVVRGGWGTGSDQVVGTCSGDGTVEVGGQTANLNMEGICNFTLPQVKANVPCTLTALYTLPAPPPFVPVSGGFSQDWTTACNTPDLDVQGLLSCDDGQGFMIQDDLGLKGRSGNNITSNICQTVFGSPTAPVFQATLIFEAPDPSARLFDLSQATSWNCCHADNPLGGTPNCIDGNDIQKCVGNATNTTRAFCSYSDPINDTCKGPDSGVFVARLHADVPANAADPLAISISLNSVAETSINVNNQVPVQACGRKTYQGQEVIECKFNGCGPDGTFVIPGGLAILTANRDTGTAIECVNEVQLR